MDRQSPLVGTILAVSMIWASGCRPQQPHYLFEDGDLSHYVGEATNIEFPDARVESLDEVEMDGQNRPLTLEHGIDPDKIWELSLEKAVQCALANNKIMRVLQQPLNESQDYLTRSPDAVNSVYAPALAETDPLSGPEAALSAFDAQLNASLYWELNDRPRNVIQNVIVSQFSVPTLQQDLGTFMAEISKTTASGSTLGVRHNVRYDMNNNPTRQWASDWNVDVEAEFRQPLLQGAGVQFNRIAGPGAAPGIYNGVVIARINSDIRLAEFEAGVRNLVSDVERAYWELYYAYRKLDAAKKARNSTLELWQQVYDRLLVGAPGGDVASEAQVREQYFFYLKTAEATLSDLYAVENNLRYIMGISATDGRLIRPSDEPTTAKIEFPWAQVHYEAMARNVDLRRQRWKVKQREMELIAAKNHLLPRLDAVGRYRWLGLGDDLIYSQGNPANQFDTAYHNMLTGNFQEWQFGVEVSIPIGFRREMAGVRHAQLNLARERSLLQEEELEVSHQMAQAIRDLEGQYRLAETGFSRLEAARHSVEALEVTRAFERPVGEGPLGIKVLLDARRQLADAEAGFYDTLKRYALAIAQVHFRKGSLLEYNNVYLAEGPWPAKAYFDATRRARARDAALYIDYGYTRPKVISRGAYEQHTGIDRGIDTSIDTGMTLQPQQEAAPEPIPAPVGEPTPLKGTPPAENRSASASGAAGFRLATDGSRDAPSRAVLGSPNTKAAPQKRSPVSVQGWAALAAKPTGTSAPGADRQDGVRPASYQQQTGSPASQGGWTAKQPSGLAASAQHESVENPPLGQADRPSSGWKKAQY